MKKTFTKIISAFLVLTMIFTVGAMSIGASAAESTVYTEGIYSYTVTDGKAKITNVVGATGDITVPSSLGGYTVTAIGEKAFGSETQLINVVSPACIETVENGAFVSCSNLETVTFEDNSKVKSLGDNAFDICRKLESIDFGENSVLENIGTSAFVYCESLVDANLPESLKSLGNFVYEGCIALAVADIPASVNEIGEGVFSNCYSLEEITVDPENETYSSDEWGILYNKDKTEIVGYPAGNKRTTFVIPAHVEKVKKYAMQGTVNLEYLTWLNPDMELGLGAFSKAESLYRVDVPEGTTFLIDWLFNACFSLVEVNLPDSLESLGSGVFHWCTSLEHIELPSGFKYIGNNAFRECYSLKSVVLPDSLIEIRGNAFQQCFSLESIEIPESVAYIGGTAFYQCYSLKEFTFPDNVYNIFGDVLRYCYDLETVNLSAGAKDIFAGAFENCRSLKTITIPEDVYIVTGEAFVNCTAFEKVVVDSANSYFSAESDGILFSKDKTKLVYYPANKTEAVYTVPETVTTIGTYAFTNAQNLATVVIPDSVAQIEANAFNGFNIRDIYFEGTQEEWNAFAVATDESLKTVQVHFEYNGTDHVHEYSQEITSVADCNTNGKKAFVCSCGAEQEVDYHVGTGRKMCYGGNFEWIDGPDSDCSVMGSAAFNCSECGFAYADRAKAKLPHNIAITVSDTKLDYKCADCGYAYSEIIPEGAHYVSYEHNGNEEVYICFDGEKPMIPASPEKAGYHFIGWADETGECVSLDTMPSRNLVLKSFFGVTVDNNSYGVTATFDEDCFDYDPSEVEFSVNLLEGRREDGGVYFGQKNCSQIMLYNLKFYHGDDEVDPKDGKTVTVSIPVPEEYRNWDTFVVTHRYTATEWDTFEVPNQNGMIVFTTGSFSEFGIYIMTDTRIGSLPKTNYSYKEALDLNGLTIEITNADGTSTVISDTSEMTVSGYDPKKIGKQTVTVEYKGVELTYEVTVSYSWWQMIIRILLLGFLWY